MSESLSFIFVSQQQMLTTMSLWHITKINVSTQNGKIILNFKLGVPFQSE